MLVPKIQQPWIFSSCRMQSVTHNAFDWARFLISWLSVQTELRAKSVTYQPIIGCSRLSIFIRSCRIFSKPHCPWRSEDVPFVVLNMTFRFGRKKTLDLERRATKALLCHNNSRWALLLENVASIGNPNETYLS